MEHQLNYLTYEWLELTNREKDAYEMATSISRQRVTIQHIEKELKKEQKRFARLKVPRLKRDSGVRVAMLKDRLRTNQNVLRELLIDKGYLSNAKVPF